MNTRLFLGYKSSSQGMFSCKGGFPLGKRGLLNTALCEVFSSLTGEQLSLDAKKGRSCPWIKGVYSGAFISGEDFPTFALMADLCEDCSPLLDKIVAQVKGYFPDAKVWGVSRIENLERFIAFSLSLQNEDAEEIVRNLSGKVYTHYRLSSERLTFFVLKEGRNFTIRGIAPSEEKHDEVWQKTCQDMIFSDASFLPIGEAYVRYFYGSCL